MKRIRAVRAVRDGAASITATARQSGVSRATLHRWLRAFDLGLNWSYKIKETVKIQPGVTIFNVFNFANFDGPAIPFSSILHRAFCCALRIDRSIYPTAHAEFDLDIEIRTIPNASIDIVA